VGPIWKSGNGPSGCTVTHRPGTQALRGARVLGDPYDAAFMTASLRDQSCFEIAPERNHQFARQCNNSDASDASLSGAGALGEPLARSAVRLVADPQPGYLDSKPARAGIPVSTSPRSTVILSICSIARRKNCGLHGANCIAPARRRGSVAIC
jgi:hypothetical protein